MWEEFKAFAIQGNVLDLAVGVIIGAAFGKIVSSLVEDIIMPVLGLVIGGIDLTKLELTVGDVAIKYGVFAQSVLDFLIIAASLFFFIKLIANFRRKEPNAVSAEGPAAPTQEELLCEIRDLLKEKITTP